MYWTLLKNDFKKNIWGNGTLLLFMGMSVTLTVAVYLMLSQLFTSIGTMYETANPPHFLQMHKGELMQEEIDEFHKEYDGVVHWQTVPMINVYGEDLTIYGIEKKSGAEKVFNLESCRLDMSLVMQNEKYDVLLSETREPLKVGQGEIGVPVILLEQYDISIGDRLVFKSGNVKKEFTVAEYVYDGQMNSTMCSSTRFLISETDFAELFGRVGETEYLIETWLTDSAMASEYQTAYEQSERNLPKSGQAVTYTMIFLLSAMTDLMTAMVYTIIGVLLIVIAVLCLRYTILASLEDDVAQIGTMKAMGISYKGIREIYLWKIRILMIAGCVLGYGLALFVQSSLTGHMSRTFGKQSLQASEYVLAALVSVCVYLVILAFGRQLLKKIKKLTIVDALVLEKGFGREHKVRDGIHRFKKIPFNWLIAGKEAGKGYGIVFWMMLLVTFLVLVPSSMVYTMKDEEFVTYMGSDIYDVLLEVEPGEGLEERREKAEQLLKEESSNAHIEEYQRQKRVRLQALDKNAMLQGIHIDTGETAGAGLQYLEGGAPQNANEIALSTLMSEELEKQTGELLILVNQGKEQEFLVCGIYQDVTSGGRTAKTKNTFEGTKAEQYSYGIQLSEKTQEEQAVEQMRAVLGNGYSIEFMKAFVDQTLGGVTAQIEKIAVVAIGIGVVLIFMIVALFMRLRLVQEAHMLAVKYAIGIPQAAVEKQELYPVLLSGGMGALLGIILTKVLGDETVSALFSLLGLGIERIHFVSMPIVAEAGILILLIGTAMASAWLLIRRIRHMDRMEYINEA